jgi:peptidyl-prolyl cis-trans isomerase D
MFDFVRKNTKFLMIVLFLLIVPSFVLLGVDGYTRNQERSATVAVVDGEKISAAEWDQAHRNQVDRMRQSMPQLDASFFDSPAMRYQTLESLVRQRVLAAAASNHHLTGTDGQLAKMLALDPSIASLRGEDGRIDMERYRQFTAAQGLSPESFENLMRGQLALQQVLGAVDQTSFASSADAAAALDAYFGQRRIQRAHYDSGAYAAQVQPSDADLQQYYQAHLDDYQSPEQADIEYLVLDLDALRKNVVVDESALRAFYEQNQAQLSSQAERRASHILIAATAADSADKRAKAKAEAERILAELRAQPQRFAELARQYSQDRGSAEQGGDLNFVSRGAMVPAFEQALFALKAKGDISDVVESEFGYHIIELTDIKQPVVQSYEQLRPKLEADYRSQQAQQAYAQAAETFTNTVYDNADSLQPAAQALKLELHRASQVQRQPAAQTQGVLANNAFLEALFNRDNIDNKRNTQAVEVGSNQMVSGRVIQYSAARTLTLDEVRERVRKQVVTSKAAELARQAGEAQLKSWQAGAQDSAGLAPQVTVSRNASHGLQHKEVDAALRADTSKLPAWIGVDLGEQGYSVIKVTASVARDTVSPQQAKAEIAEFDQLWARAESQAYYQWLKQQYKVEIKAAKPAADAFSADKS